MMRSSDAAELCTVTSDSCCSTESGVRSRMSIMPSTPFIGVRISWLTVARKVDLAWLAFSASR